MSADELEWIEDGGLLSVPGWRAAATRSGVKPSGGYDLALFVADAPCRAAAVWTRNALAAAPVVLGRERLRRSRTVRSVAINAGNANALTGPRGFEDAQRMVERTELRCGGPALVLSTGIIGVPLPIDKVLDGIDTASERLSAACPEAYDAILTTDTCRKTTAVEVELPAAGAAPAHRATVGGVAKGSGMIHPNMATMLAVVATDAPVESTALDALLRDAVDASFHEITVDGDTSTNDAVLLLAREPRGQETPIGPGDPRLPALQAAITAVMERLARTIIEDGEGRTRTMELVVEGADGTTQAREIARSVATSSLVKTALAGGDPNWGRILAAAANAGVEIDGSELALDIQGVRVFGAHGPNEYDARALAQAFAAPVVAVHLVVGRGAGRARMWTTDLSSDYVRINSEYST